MLPALMRDSITRPNVFSYSAFFPSPSHPLTTFCEETAPKTVGGAAGRDETPAAHSVPTRRATTWTKRRTWPSRGHRAHIRSRPGRRWG
jgi:hypothetical protein